MLLPMLSQDKLFSVFEPYDPKNFTTLRLPWQFPPEDGLVPKNFNSLDVTQKRHRLQKHIKSKEPQKAHRNWNKIVLKSLQDSGQGSSLLLQYNLKYGDPDTKLKIIEVVSQHPLELMTSKYGNFVVQEALQRGTNESLEPITKVISENVGKLAIDTYGSHAVQTVLTVFNDPTLRKNIIQGMMSDIGNTVQHKYACYVWQKVFQVNWSGPQKGLVNVMAGLTKQLENKWVTISFTLEGSLVVQAVIEYCSNSSIYKASVTKELMAGLELLMKDQYGNWVVKKLLQFGSKAQQTLIINHIIDNAITYSFDKHGSYVIVKMFSLKDCQVISRYLKAITSEGKTKSRKIVVSIACDEHGTKCVQFILKHGTFNQKKELVSYLEKEMSTLRKSKNGHKCCSMVKAVNYSAEKQ